MPVRRVGDEDVEIALRHASHRAGRQVVDGEERLERSINRPGAASDAGIGAGTGSTLAILAHRQEKPRLENRAGAVAEEKKARVSRQRAAAVVDVRARHHRPVPVRALHWSPEVAARA